MLVILEKKRKDGVPHNSRRGRRRSIQSKTAITPGTMREIRRSMTMLPKPDHELADMGTKSPAPRSSQRRRKTAVGAQSNMTAVHAAVAAYLAQGEGGEERRTSDRGTREQDHVPADTWKNMQLVRMVACGGAHTAVLTVSSRQGCCCYLRACLNHTVWVFSPVRQQNQDVWTCGEGTLGQLGHGDTRTRMRPKMVKALQGKSVCWVCFVIVRVPVC